MSTPIPKTTGILKEREVLDNFKMRYQARSNIAYWVYLNFGINLHSNQIEIVKSVCDLEEKNIAILQARGAGKTFAVGIALLKLCVEIPNLKIGVFGPKTEQATRIISEITTGIVRKKSEIYKKINWKDSVKSRLIFHNGSEIVALSADESAMQEGWHFNIVVLDECHRIPDVSINQRIAPMLGSLPIGKTIKLGISMYKNNFWKSCVSNRYKVLKRDWLDCKILLRLGSIKYNGKEYPKYVVDRLPLKVNEQLFPDRPDLHFDGELSEIDYKTQYNMEWVSDINLELDEADQKTLIDSEFEILKHGRPELQEKYFFGLDTAAGTLLPGKRDLDFTALAIWRRRSDNVKEKVACFSGDTKIRLLDGTSKTIEELANLDSLDNIWVYSIDENKNIVPGKVSRAWKTGIRGTIKVTLDNGEIFHCTPDHRIMLRDGSYKEAGQLQANDSLMPLYTASSKKGSLNKALTGYELVYNPGTETWEYTHKLVAENIYGDTAWPNVTHHVDFNKTNSNPNNLLVLPFKDHVKLHAALSLSKEARQRATQSRINTLNTWTEQERKAFGHKISIGLRPYHKTKRYKETCRKAGEASLKSRTPEQLDYLRRKGCKRSSTFCEKQRVSHLGKTHTERTKKYLSDLRKSQHAETRCLNHTNWKKSLISRSKSLKILDEYGASYVKDYLATHTIKESCIHFACGKKTIWKLKIRLNLIISKSDSSKKLLYRNHRVVCIEKSVVQDVYDITVDKYHNFALDTGIFVHNCYEWQGDIVNQIKEIKAIIHPVTGIFRCTFGLADYSNIAQSTIAFFQKENIPIEGIMFNQTESASKKNMKNAMFDQFKFELQSGRVKYPPLNHLDKNVVFKKAFNEWCNIERHRRLGINDLIEAPSDLHDDHPCADVLAVWAMDKTDSFKNAVSRTMNLPSPQINTVSPVYGRRPGSNENRYLK